jgi:protein-S-isoprenylcysteine O-methyltransferase Ste14
MNGPEPTLLGELKHQIGSLQADLRQMLLLRWQLVRIEVQAAVGQIKRLGVALLIFGVMLLSSLPILAVAAAQSLHGHGLSFAQWLLIFGLGLLLGGAAGGYLAWRGFRRRFMGIEQTLEELREDGVWLRQWLPSGQDTEGPGDAA